jgi:ribosomal protein S18 acetylase RimI-like enzyme
MLINRLVCALVMCASFVAHADIRYEIHHGPISDLHRAELTPLRAHLFHDYPYLYCSNPEREKMIFNKLSKDSTALVLAYDNDKLVGALITLEMSEDDAKILHKHPDYAPGKWLEIDMAMVLKSHQRRGIVRELLRHFKADAIARGYTDVYGITVVRSENHPLKPKDFIDLCKVWSDLGGTRTGLTAAWNWPTRCGIPGAEFIAPIDNMIEYWHTTL